MGTYASIAQARDEITAMLNAAVNGSAVTNPSTGTTPLLLIWDGVEQQPAKPQPPSSWARVSIKHLTGDQTSLAGGNQSTRRYTKDGIIAIQLFTDPNGLTAQDAILPIVLGAYQGKSAPSGAWFRKPTHREIGMSESWWHTNIFVEFTYDIYL